MACSTCEKGPVGIAEMRNQGPLTPALSPEAGAREMILPLIHQHCLSPEAGEREQRSLVVVLAFSNWYSSLSL